MQLTSDVVSVANRDSRYYISYPSCPGLIGKARSVALGAGVPEGAIVNGRLGMGSEDASYIMREVQKNGGRPRSSP